VFGSGVRVAVSEGFVGAGKPLRRIFWFTIEIAAVLASEFCALKFWYLAGSSSGDTQLARLLGIAIGIVSILIAHEKLHDPGDAPRYPWL
jgi:hypothetical protein